MAVISVRLNDTEEKMIKYLSEHFEVDRSALIKRSLVEMYEDLKDRETIERFEKKEKSGGKPIFLSSDEILKDLSSD